MVVDRADSAAFLSAIILAAGASKRLGRPKQLLLLGDRPLLQHVIDAAVAARLIDEVVVVLGHRAEEIDRVIVRPFDRQLRVVTNPDYASGQSASLRSGLRSASRRAVAAAILLGDQPGISSAVIDTVARAFLAGEHPVARPVYTRAGGRRVPGHPVFLARRIWPEVENLRGDKGARSLLNRHPEWVLEVPVEGEPLIDIDTAAGYEEAVDAARARTVREHASPNTKSGRS